METYFIKTSNILENLFKNFHNSFCNTEIGWFLLTWIFYNMITVLIKLQ